MPGTTLRLDETDHRMLQMLAIKTGKSQNVLLLELLHRECAEHGITREAITAMVQDPHRFWTAQGKQPPVIDPQTHAKVMSDLAEIDADSDAERHAA